MANANNPIKKKIMSLLNQREERRDEKRKGKKWKYRREADKRYEEYLKKNHAKLVGDLPEEEEIEFYGGGGYMKPKYKRGGKLGKKKSLDFNKDGKITKADFIMMAKAKMKRKGKK